MVESSHAAGFWPSLYEPFRSVGHRIADFFAPASEAGANGDAYQIDLELPGVKKDDISISQHDNVLTVKGEKRSSRTEKTDSVFFCERQYGSFQRTFRLPPDSDPEKIDASFNDGVLSLNIPKRAPETPAARAIKISSN